MTIQETIEKAIEGGWNRYRDFTFISVRSYKHDPCDPLVELVGLVEGKKASNIVSCNDIFLDPLFWQALGRALGWNKEFRIGDWVETPHGEGKITSVENIPNGQVRVRYREGGLMKYGVKEVSPSKPLGRWLENWHKFIDHLAKGGTPAEYFNEL